MKEKLLEILNTCFLFLVFVKVEGQPHNANNTPMIELWKNATLKNINSQLALKPCKGDRNFYQKILLNESEFIVNQSKPNGLRDDFIEKILKTSEFVTASLEDAYIVEYYCNGEAFKAEINLYSFGGKKRFYKYAFQFGKWKCIVSMDLIDSSIVSVFHSINNYLCDEYHTDESIFVSHIDRQVFTTEALVFPCSGDFKRVKRTLSLQ